MILPTPRVALSSCQVVKTGSDRQHRRSLFDDLMTLKQSISRITSRAAELHITMGRSNKKRKILLCMSTCLASSFKQMNHFIQIEDLNALLCVMTENMTTDIQSFVQKLQAFGCCCIQMDPDIDGDKSKVLLLCEDYSEPGFRGGICLVCLKSRRGFAILLAG